MSWMPGQPNHVGGKKNKPLSAGAPTNPAAGGFGYDAPNNKLDNLPIPQGTQGTQGTGESSILGMQTPALKEGKKENPLLQKPFNLNDHFAQISQYRGSMPQMNPDMMYNRGFGSSFNPYFYQNKQPLVSTPMGK